MPPTRIEVAASAGSYPIVIGSATLATLPQLLDDAGLGPRRVIVSSPTVWEFHGDAVKGAASEAEPILVPDGERHKNITTVGRVYDALIQIGADRSVVIIAVGGGVIGDLVGFAAATYLRGVRVVHVPTTLMAQVDSAVGGKTGVNHALGKNLIGAFHPPRLVVADPAVLATLPRREFRAGLYEVVKYGVIASPSLLDRVEASLPQLFKRDPDATAAVVAESCRIKARVVSADEHESGLRRTLNFGHTIGHAIEAVTKYKRFRHGEAVGYGMLAAMALGEEYGVTPAVARQRLAAVIAKLGPLPPVVDLSASEVLAAIGRDKKIVAGTLHFVAATAIGATTTVSDVTEQHLRRALKAIGIS
ncbi:MAG TPA: 3-dehydroquinate synthase [Vicinamibacterales bacterium]|nr:3-dehydroquinate synthase [Vicinamibacterales bacterium]